jgi:hypothetical protein
METRQPGETTRWHWLAAISTEPDSIFSPSTAFRTVSRHLRRRISTR